VKIFSYISYTRENIALMKKCIIRWSEYKKGKCLIRKKYAKPIAKTNLAVPLQNLRFTSYYC
jgi:hypothetical protein